MPHKQKKTACCEKTGCFFELCKFYRRKISGFRLSRQLAHHFHVVLCHTHVGAERFALCGGHLNFDDAPHIHAAGSRRKELDKLPELAAFADKLEKATIQTIEDGVMTGDLYLISKLENKKKVNSKEFLEAIRERLDALMA